MGSREIRISMNYQIGKLYIIHYTLSILHLRTFNKISNHQPQTKLWFLTIFFDIFG
ncbi:MAG: hypothetical protein BWZ06_00579 [Bacteroidetes bacterium ADurb.BinA261]|nr:MAG: hypothetical protein BWZ06_00579 [Bacteroidetes bacterium ADurb.BinA261]